MQKKLCNGNEENTLNANISLVCFSNSFLKIAPSKSYLYRNTISIPKKKLYNRWQRSKVAAKRRGVAGVLPLLDF